MHLEVGLAFLIGELALLPLLLFRWLFLALLLLRSRVGSDVGVHLPIQKTVSMADTQ